MYTHSVSLLCLLFTHKYACMNLHVFINDQEPTLDHLREALRTLSLEQQDVSLRAANYSSSLNRLNKRLLLYERHLVALSRREERELEEGGVVREGEGEEEKVDRERGQEEKEEHRLVWVIICMPVHVLLSAFSF